MLRKRRGEVGVENSRKYTKYINSNIVKNGLA